MIVWPRGNAGQIPLHWRRNGDWFLCTFYYRFQVPVVKTLTDQIVPKASIVFTLQLGEPGWTLLALVVKDLSPRRFATFFNQDQAVAAAVSTRKRILSFPLNRGRASLLRFDFAW